MKKPVLFILLLGSVLSVAAQTDLKYIRKGNKSYEEGKYRDAEVDYRKALENDSFSFKGKFNLGDALYQQKNYEESTKLFTEISENIQSKNQKAQVYHNLGNSLLEAKKYKESIEAYKQALRNNPEDLDTKYNLAYALKKLQQQQQQQQQNDKNKDQKNKDQQKQNKDKKEQKKQQQQQQKKQEQQQQQQNKEGQNKQKAARPQEISKEDAKRMLEALKNNEKKTLQKLLKIKAKSTKARKNEKDW